MAVDGAMPTVALTRAGAAVIPGVRRVEAESEGCKGRMHCTCLLAFSISNTYPWAIFVPIQARMLHTASLRKGSFLAEGALYSAISDLLAGSRLDGSEATRGTSPGAAMETTRQVAHEAAEAVAREFHAETYAQVRTAH